MRKIIERTIIGIFVLAVLAVCGWAGRVFLNASANRDGNAAVSTVKEIRESELVVKSKYGRYFTLDELIKEKAVPANVRTANQSFTFEIDLRENGFHFNALPKVAGDVKTFSIDDKGTVTIEE